MHETSIIELIEERIDRGDTDLPVFSFIALELQDQLSQDNYNMSDISEIIHKDQTLATQILKVGNSAFFRGLKPVMTIQDTVVRLGIKNIVNIAMMITQKQVYRSERRNLNQLMDRLWRHALAAALACRYLADRLGLDKTSEVGFLSGLIHDIGKLLLVKIIEDLQKSESLPGDISEDLIIDILEDMHCIQGERLIQQLNLPDTYCRVVAEHHENNSSEDDTIMDLVRLSNLACRKLGIGIRSDPGIMLSTTPEATRLLANDLLLAELQVKMEEQIDSVEKLLRADWPNA